MALPALLNRNTSKTKTFGVNTQILSGGSPFVAGWPPGVQPLNQQSKGKHILL